MLAGDQRAFDSFFESHFPLVYRFALSRLDRDENAAEEVAQATLCKAIGKLRTYRGEAALASWLCTFCKRELSAFHKRRRRLPLDSGSERGRATLESAESPTSEGPGELLDKREVSRLVHATLDALPPHYGNALEWKYIDGLPVKEIADRLELSPKAAESLLTRARDAFRDGYRATTREPLPRFRRSEPVESSS